MSANRRLAPGKRRSALASLIVTVVRLLLVLPPVGLKSTWSLTFSLPFLLTRLRARLVSFTFTVTGPPLTRKAFVAISLRAFFALAKAGGQDAAAKVRRAGTQVTPTSCGEQTAPLPGMPGGSVSLSRAVMHSRRTWPTSGS